MINLTKADLDSLARFLRGYPINDIDARALEHIYASYPMSSLFAVVRKYPVLFRGIQSNMPLEKILDQAKCAAWSSWSTDINIAIYFAKTCKRGRQAAPYLLISIDQEGIDVCSVMDLAKNVQSLQGNSLETCSKSEKEVILRGSLNNVYIMEIPDTYNIP